MLVVVLINFGVKNQVLQVSFKVVARDLISFLTLGSDLNLFGYYLILFGSSFKFHEPSVMLVVGFINFGVTNQVPQVFFKFAAGDLVLVSSYEVADILFCESLAISEAISDYKSKPFSPIDLDLPTNSYKIACTNIQNFEEEENYASTVSVDHNFVYDMKLIVYYMILFVSDLIFLWKLNPGVRTITLTKIVNYARKLHTKETEYGVEH